MQTYVSKQRVKKLLLIRVWKPAVIWKSWFKASHF